MVAQMMTLLVKQRKYLHLETEEFCPQVQSDTPRTLTLVFLALARVLQFRCCFVVQTLTFVMFISIERPVYVGFHWTQFTQKEASLQLFTML